MSDSALQLIEFFDSFQGSPPVRRGMSNQIKQGRFNVLMTTYEYVIKDKATLAKVSVGWYGWERGRRWEA